MKNHIVFKFIAVALCAASLLGAVGSGLGIFVMTESGLYDKTVDEIYQERLQSEGSYFAQDIVYRYASLNLGSCPDEMVSGHYGYWDNYFNYGYYGYTLKDAEGNALDSLQIAGMENWTDAVTYEFPGSGEYMYVLSTTPESEKYPEVESERTVIDGETAIYDAIPYEGVGVTHITMTDTDGSSSGMGSDEEIGFLYHDEWGYLIFEASQPEMFGMEDGAVMPLQGIAFMDSNGELLYEASSPDFVGTLFCDNGMVTYSSHFQSSEYAAPEVTLAAETEPTLAPTEETAASETVPETTAETATGISGELTKALNIYQTTDINSEVVGRFSAGYTVELLTMENVDGTYWGQTDLGWILLGTVKVTANIPEADPNADIAVINETLPAETVDSTAPTLAEETVPETTAAMAETVPEVTAAAEVTETVPAAPDAPTATEATNVPEALVETEPAQTIELVITDDGIYTYEYYDTSAQEMMHVEYTYAQMPEYTVELTLRPGALRYESFYQVLDLVWEYRNELFIVLVVNLLLFAILAVYLCCTAGRKPGSDEIHAAGLNCIPLDAYLCGGILGISCLFMVIAEGGDHLLRQNLLVGCIFAVGMAYVACLIFVAFCFAFAAQAKTPGGYWWRHSCCGFCLGLVVRFSKWGFRSCGKLPPVLKKIFSQLWTWAVALFLFGMKVVRTLYELAKKAALWLLALAKKWLKKLWKAVDRFLSLLPLTWQWMLMGFLLLLWLLIAVDSGSEGLLVAWACFGIALVLYASYCFGILLESAKRMSKGDLDTKVDDKLMVGCFDDFAENLNNLADVAVVAAQKQLKSERMKTELITNVSHDIKTPLTSIINYVDLLQKPHTDAQQEQYLEVLDRQSQRLKKLIDDLMEMSKASTGNLTVDITKVDAIESVNQALGEFADKLDKVQLTPVFRRPEESVAMMADGRLVWRVLSNLLSNAVKYAMPGTRLYIDLMELEGKVIISLKNISRDELNVDADELMERFVRGDDSRNTEGSGLGLNIAKSLMELQKGQLQLLVDGDLFKVTLIFPGA